MSNADALTEAADALEGITAGRIVDGDPIPGPPARRTGEHRVAVPPTTAAKAALVLAFRGSGLSRVGFARRLGVDERLSAACWIHATPPPPTGSMEALKLLGRELVVESTAA